MITLRPDQTETIARVYDALRTTDSVMLQAQTGWGKTVAASKLAIVAHNHGRRVVFGVHRRELLLQTSRTFRQFGIPHGFIAAGMAPDPFAHVQIASADTLRSRRHWLKCHLFVPDEAHLWAADTRAAMIQEVRANGGKVVGLSATPQRLDGRALSGLFGAMVQGPSVEWLMDQGFLSRYRAFAPIGPGTDGLHVRGGDYVTAELDERFNKPTVIGDAIRTWRQHAAGLRTMAFAFSRKHGAALTDAYNQNGISAVYIDGETPPVERRSRIADFADGRAMVLVSINLAIEGFDLSAQVGRDVPVEAVALLRPTASMPMARQMIGRALRPKSAPAVIMDHVRLLAMHGLPDDPVEWTLEGRDKKAGSSTASVSLTVCKSCYFTGRTFSTCPNCGAVSEVVGRQVEEVDGEIAELDLDAMRAAKKIEVRRARSVEDLIALGRSRGYKNPAAWARHVTQARQRA